MHATLPLLVGTDFPPLKRGRLQTLQVNLGYKCNQSCLHCHVNAGPKRTEMMSRETIDQLLDYIDSAHIKTLDLTGGAPELNQHFKYLVTAARRRNLTVIDRCNLTILFEPGQQDTAQFLADNQVKVVASLPCYMKDNVDAQRGDGTFESSLDALRLLNSLGYAQRDTGLELDLVYNPQGAELPPPQEALEADYKQHLSTQYGIEFNQLLTITNMPIKRFGSTLVSHGEFNNYMALLKSSHQHNNTASVMCRTLVSVDWQGYVFDCDFNQMLDLPLQIDHRPKLHITDLVGQDIENRAIRIADHCYACTAGQGSSCGGALES